MAARSDYSKIRLRAASKQWKARGRVLRPAPLPQAAQHPQRRSRALLRRWGFGGFPRQREATESIGRGAAYRTPAYALEGLKCLDFNAKHYYPHKLTLVQNFLRLLQPSYCNYQVYQIQDNMRHVS